MAGITVAVGAVILDDTGRILLVKHKTERGGFWQGKWICPGGRLEVGETIQEGIIREVKEETHLDIELVRPVPPFDRVVKECGDTVLHVVYVDYVARKTGGDLMPDDDVGYAMWASCADIENMADELHEDTRKLLKMAQPCVDSSKEGRAL